jgi:eukaryotic-like serine/threonine-protein kinase
VTTIPTTIGRYLVENLVGRGGMGQIYKAHDPVIHRSVAIKLISTELMSGADRIEYIRRFRREAQAAGRCAHPNIVAIYDFALHEEQPFLAMEFVDGVSLREALDAASGMAVSDAIRIMLQVLDALASAHAMGVIHQDIKPANILLTTERRVKVADFGISRFVNTEVTSIAASMGTPNYMSPEQCRGSRVDSRSDLFSAGATLYEMVAGERAFPGHTLTEISNRILNESLPMLPAHVRAAAPRLQFVLERAMAKQPDDRFDTGYDMAEALRQVLASSAGDEDENRTLISRSGSVMAAGSATTDGPKASPSTGQQAVGPQFDADILRIVEQKLTGYVGPIARILVRTAANRSKSVDDLCLQLALSIHDDGERDRFRREVGLVTRSRSPEADSGSLRGEKSVPNNRFPEHELERVRAALTQFMGPIARVLVRRAAADAPSVEALWLSLSNQIESSAERSAFLRQRPK